MTQKFTVGLKCEGKAIHLEVEAEDALVAALKAKIAHPDAIITYSRRSNQRGDKRNPPEERLALP